MLQQVHNTDPTRWQCLIHSRLGSRNMFMLICTYKQAPTHPPPSSLKAIEQGLLFLREQIEVSYLSTMALSPPHVSLQYGIAHNNFTQNTHGVPQQAVFAVVLNYKARKVAIRRRKKSGQRSPLPPIIIYDLDPTLPLHCLIGTDLSTLRGNKAHIHQQRETTQAIEQQKYGAGRTRRTPSLSPHAIDSEQKKKKNFPNKNNL